MVIPEKTKVIRQGCPLCGNDLRGNDKAKYYCKECNVLFDERHLHKPT